MMSVALRTAATAGNLQIDYPLRVMVIGGAISVLKHRSRLTTHDVDFYHPNVAVMKFLVKLGGEVSKAKGWNGAFYWFNDAVANIIDGDIEYSQVFSRSLRSNEAIYASHDLVLVPVDPYWQLHRKVARVSKGLRLGTGVRPEDMHDALYLLHQHLTSNNKPMTKSEFRNIYPNSTTAKISDTAIENVANAYRAHYNSIGLVLNEW